MSGIGKYLRSMLAKSIPMLLLFFSLGLIYTTQAQTDTSALYTPEKIMTGNFSAFFTDNLHYFYLLSPSANGFRKYNSKLDSVGAFNEVRKFGSIWDIDANNALKTIVFYKDYNTVVILDRLLNVTATFDLRKTGILQSTAVALSYDNMLWIYDSRESKIKKINDNGEVVFESADFKALFSQNLQPQKIIDYDGILYVYDKNEGLYIFDYYGAFKKNYAYTDLDDVQIYKNIFYGRKENSIFMYELKGWREKNIHLNILPVAQMQIQHPNIYLLSNGNIFSYKLEE